MDRLVDNTRARGEQLRAGLQALGKSLPGKIAEVRGWGLMLGLELGPAEPRSAAEIASAALQAGLLLVPAGPRVVRFVPPLIVSQAEIDEGLALLATVLR